MGVYEIFNAAAKPYAASAWGVSVFSALEQYRQGRFELAKYLL